MKTIFFVLFVFFLQDSLRAQTYIPTVAKGKVWGIKYPVGMGAYKYYSTRVECDTTINLIQYNNVYLMGNTICKLGSIREDTINHKVYFVDTGSSIENMILDYDLVQGDSFNGMTVVLVYYQVKFGQLRKVILFTQPYEWIEGIGASMYGLYDLTWAGGTVIDVTQNISNCMPLLIDNSSFLQNIELKYAGNIISVNTQNEENKHIEIFNTVGQLLYKEGFKKSTAVDISNFSKQLLVVHIYGMKGHFTQKVLLQ